MGPCDLEELLAKLPVFHDPRILSGSSPADDAGVFKLNPNTTIIQTVDFFAPIVDDPYDYGAIVAANSMSDIFAMGGKPITALNIASFPEELEKDILASVLKGGMEKAREAGVFVLGGHTARDKEVKYGMAVTGILTGESFTANSTAETGDILILTKPLGLGIITTAAKMGVCSPNVLGNAVKVMKQLNKSGAELMMKYGAHSATDITGFGFMGHAYRMAKFSKTTFVLDEKKFPVLDGTLELLSKGIYPAGSVNNRKYVEPHILWEETVEEAKRKILCDAQTSGGLLISVDAENSCKLLNELEKAGYEYASAVGEVIERKEHEIWVR
ncbi:MAG: selenide, water dikinase SelD [Vulcanimicrobiota bacterium]